MDDVGEDKKGVWRIDRLRGIGGGVEEVWKRRCTCQAASGVDRF